MKRSSFVMQSGLALRALAVIIVMLTATTARADDSGECGASGNNVTWALTDEDGDNVKETLTISGSGAMKNYSSLISDSAPWYDNRESIKTVIIENGVTSIGNCVFVSCSNLTSVTIPSSVTCIGDNAFFNCGGLTSINIPSSVTGIGEYAFSMTGLTSVTIPSNVTSIGKYAFCKCTGLTSVTIPNKVTSIEDATFSNCTNLSSVTIPSSVTSIGELAFNLCKSLTSVTIPVSMTSIGSDAFYGCANLTDVFCYADPDRLTWNENGCDDFIITAKTTICHVAGSKLATFHSKWSKGENTDVNVSFVGDGIEPGGVDYVVEPVTYKSGTAPEGVKAFLPVSYDLGTATVTLAEVTGAPKGMPVIYGSAKVDEAMPNLFFLNYVAEDSDDDKAIQSNYDSKANAMSDRFVITDGKDNLFTILGGIDGVTASDAIFFVLANGKFTRVNVSADDLADNAKPAKPGLLLFILSKWEYMNMGSNEGGSTNATRGIGISDGGETTRIRPPLTPPTQEGKGCAQWYDLQGRRIEKPTRKGLYIFKGKKVAIK